MPTETVTRTSSVDSLMDSPGYGTIDMHTLWNIADKASDVVIAARQHLGYGPEDRIALDLLLEISRSLLAVMEYSVSLRRVDRLI